MPRFHNINGERVQFTADEETAHNLGFLTQLLGPRSLANAKYR